MCMIGRPVFSTCCVSRCVILTADYCQIELRMMAHFSEDPDLVATLCDPTQDVFRSLAAKWKGIEPSHVGATQINPLFYSRSTC